MSARSSCVRRSDMPEFKAARRWQGGPGRSCPTTACAASASHFSMRELREESGRQHRVGEGRRHHPDDHGDTSAVGNHAPPMDDDEEGGGRVDKIADGSGARRDTAGPAQRRLRDVRRSTASGPMTSCSSSSIPNWSSSSSRCRQSAAGFVARRLLHQVPGRFFSMHLQDVDLNATPPPPPPGTPQRGAGTAAASRRRSGRAASTG